MSTAFFKFPSTPHLAWLGNGEIREDKVFPETELAEFLSHQLVIEEKIDGANLGISVSQEGELLFQNRGSWLEGELSGQWSRLKSWAISHTEAIRINLPSNCILFGEWCFAKHSISYERLPDWFIGFDIFDRSQNKFWSTQRRNNLLEVVGLEHISEVSRGQFTLNTLSELLNWPSSYSSSKMEGLYLRHESSDFLEQRAKLVNPAFSQSILQHWSKKQLKRNGIIRGQV